MGKREDEVGWDGGGGGERRTMHAYPGERYNEQRTVHQGNVSMSENAEIRFRKEKAGYPPFHSYAISIYPISPDFIEFLYIIMTSIGELFYM